ncbi:MAG: hypothetical protein HWD86_08355 [Kangiellaceae bacterium]|nr:hypothetical protein [Kangiellaceae bacterium]
MNKTQIFELVFSGILIVLGTLLAFYDLANWHLSFLASALFITSFVMSRKQKTSSSQTRQAVTNYR